MHDDYGLQEVVRCVNRTYEYMLGEGWMNHRDSVNDLRGYSEDEMINGDRSTYVPLPPPRPKPSGDPLAYQRELAAQRELAEQQGELAARQGEVLA